MATGNVFKDNGYTYTSGDVFNDAGQTLIAATNYYVSASGLATWVTDILFYGTGAIVGGTVKLLLYIPGNDLGATGNAATNLTDAIDLAVASGWNTVHLPTPRALPVYSGTGAVQKFTVGLYTGPAAYYVGRDPVGAGTVPSALTGLFYSAAADSNNPTSRGSFKYGTWPTPSGAQGTFNLWNGTDIQVTDVPPAGGFTADTSLTETVSTTAAASKGTSGGSATPVSVGRTAAATRATSSTTTALGVTVGTTSAASAGKPGAVARAVAVGTSAAATRATSTATTPLSVSVGTTADATVTSAGNAAASLVVTVGTTSTALRDASAGTALPVVVGTTAGATRSTGAATALPVAVSTSATAARTANASTALTVTVGLTAAATVTPASVGALAVVNVATSAAATRSVTASAILSLTVATTATMVSSSDAFVIEDYDYDALIPRKYQGFLPPRKVL